MNNLNRRSVLRVGAMLVGAPLFPAVVGAGPAAAATGAATTGTAAVLPAAWSVHPRALSDVRLASPLFTAKRDRMLSFARGYDINRLLQVFRANAGLPTLGAVAPGGWEGLDGEANGNLRGHFTGHYLSMLSQAYGSTGEAGFAETLDYAVGALTDVRAALRTSPAVLSGPGRFGSAVELLRGSNQYIDLPSTVLGGSAAITLACWVKPSSSASWARVFDFGNNTQRYMYLTARNGGEVPRFAITTNYAGGEQGINATAALPTNAWSHLAVTISGTTGTLWVNGVAVGTNPSMTLNPSVLGTLTNNWLGRSNYAGDAPFAGAFDDVNIWSRALTSAQLAQLQTGPAAGSGVGAGDLAGYALDETSGGTLADQSGQARHGTLRRTWGGPSHPGFLAAYPETQFIALESMTSSDYTRVWAPYYTAHKILRGLFDAYQYTGDARALDLASGMCDWMYYRLSALPKATLQRMWGLFSSGEFGGMQEAVCDVYAVTGKAEHLALARLFDLDSLINACAAGTDVLNGLHANQHIPIFTGLLRLHDETRQERYLSAARNFWPMVTPARAYSIGGTSTGEFWKAAGAVAGTISDVNAETCCAYNMLKLSRMLFFHSQDAKYIDYYERTLFNQVLGSKQDKAEAEKPLATYFIGLTPGHVRDYTPKQGTTCCEGTGMESATKYTDSVFFTSADQNALYVNLFIGSTLTWAERGITVEQKTDFPFEQQSRLRIRGRDSTFDLNLRIPAWARTGVRVTVNGQAVAGPFTAGSYLRISRSWRDGDLVKIDFPFQLRVEKALDNPAIQTLFYGPINLVARDPRTSYLQLALYRNAALSGDLLPTFTPVAGKPLHYTLDGIEFAPFFEGTEDPTHVYFRRAEPAIVLGNLDSGVANPATTGGTTFLDELWAGAPYPARSDFLEAVTGTVASWVQAGRLGTADGDQVVLTARRASYQR
jgi:uncharacterized protein